VNGTTRVEPVVFAAAAGSASPPFGGLDLALAGVAVLVVLAVVAFAWRRARRPPATTDLALPSITRVDADDVEVVGTAGPPTDGPPSGGTA